MTDGDPPVLLPSSLFSANESANVVNARMGAGVDPRLHEIMTALVSHLHALVRETSLTSQEWSAAIDFLTQVGQTCSEWRQEFILLSDVLGVSMLVDAINHDRPFGATENTVLGPFHVSDAPLYPNGATISLDGKGDPLLVRGQVRDLAGAPIAGATLDVWQANEDGFYDVQQRDIQPDMNLRGVFTTDYEGRYHFWSAKPRWYPIPDDGPVGRLLAALGRKPNRAAHLHFIVSAIGFDTVVTHIFAPDCPHLHDDAVFGVKPSLIADFMLEDDPSRAGLIGVCNPFWSVEWDFVLASDKTCSEKD